MTVFTAELITSEYGERCPDHEPGCPICDAWAQYDAICSGAYRNRKRSLADLDDVVSEIMARNPDFVDEINRIIDGVK